MTAAPPLRLPGEHFVAALCFLIAGALGIWHVAPALAAGAYPDAAVVAVTHLLTLGWLTTSIMGALYQFLPVALGEGIASERLAHVTFALHVAGVALLTVGVAAHHAAAISAGVASLGFGFTGFLGNLAVTLRRASRHDLTWWSLCFAAAFLGVTYLLGGALAAHRITGFLGGTHGVALRTHVHVALFGWVLLVIVGVSHRLLPMFLLSHGAGDRFAWWALRLIAAGATILTLFHHVSVLGRELPAALLALGMAAWAVQARAFFRSRHRPRLDAGLRLSAAGISLLALTPVALGRFLLPNVTPAYQTAYVSLVVLGCTLFVAAHYYKIIPFLIWNRHFGPLAGTRPLPRVSDLYAGGEAMVAVALLAIGAALLIAGVLASAPPVVRAGAVFLSAGAVMEARQLWGVSRRRP